MSVTSTEELINELERMPAQKPAVTLVLRALDDPDTGALDVARSLAGDPVLTARIMRIANSAYYGMSGRVGSPQFAVSVLGFNTVRALVTAVLSGVSGPNAPSGFWLRAAHTAVSASLLAPKVGVKGPDAFCAGMLSDLGWALLHQVDSTGHEELRRRALKEGVNLDILEREHFGLSARQAAARVLEAWHLPQELTTALGIEPRDVTVTHDELTRALALGRILTAHCLGGLETLVNPAPISGGTVLPSQLGTLVPEVKEQAALLDGALRQI